MWKLVINFDDDETVTFRGEEPDIPLTIAIRYYDLFVKEAEGKAVVFQGKNTIPMFLADKILQLAGEIYPANTNS